MTALLRRISIRQRLLGSLLVVAAIILGLGGWATAAYRALQTASEQMLDAQAAVGRESSRLMAALERVQRHEQSVLLNGNNPTESAEHLARWKGELVTTRQQLLSASAGAASAEVLQALQRYADAVGPVLQQVVEARMDATAGYAYAGQALPDLDQARNTLARWVTDTETRIQTERAELAENGQRGAALRLGAAVVVLAAFGVVMMWMVHSIAAPLSHATGAAERIAQGDLSQQLDDTAGDEVGHFMRALAAMQTSLRTIVGQVRLTADGIQTASQEVATGNLDLSQRTEHTASNLQQTAAAMEQLSGTVHHSASSAQQAHQLAGTARTEAERGGTVVAQVVQTMDTINQASRQIAEITGVIDGIAFQTNILALNAAVEAARAGEQGRGFAVVAGEVRLLAQRSAEAARQIKSLIGASVERVENGARQVQAAGQTMHDIVASVRRVNDIIGEISSAADEQSRGIGQVGQAVGQLDQMTQQNAALVEQSAAAAESLKNQAEQLNALVATFQLEPATPDTLPALQQAAH